MLDKRLDQISLIFWGNPWVPWGWNSIFSFSKLNQLKSKTIGGFFSLLITNTRQGLFHAGSFLYSRGVGLETPLLHTFPTCVHPCNEIFYVCKIINYKNILVFSKIYKVFFQIAAGVLCYHLIRSIKRKAKSKEQQVFF